MSNQASKRSLTLNLASGGPPKRARVAAAVAGASTSAANAPLLTTPDVQMLKLSSPEMAKFLNSANGLATPTPSGYTFPKTVTEEQELYAKGFEDALKKMQQGKTDQETAIQTIEKATAAHNTRQPRKTTSRPPSRPSSSASGSVGDSSESSYNAVQIKEEADDDVSIASTDDGRLGGGSSLSPIDMESQEKIKLERKRLRNRVAASKCRKRKLEKISLLDEKVQQLKGENSELASVVKRLKASVCDLKQEVMEHMNNGCQIVLSEAAGF